MGLPDKNNSIEKTSENLKFASAVAQFGLILRDFKYKGNASFSNIENLANSSPGSDLKSYRNDFLDLFRKAAGLKRES